MDFGKWRSLIDEYTELTLKAINAEKEDRKKKLDAQFDNFAKFKRMKKHLKIMLLGFTQVGKSYYLASINHLKRGTYEHFFSLQSEDFTRLNRISETYNVVTGSQKGAINTTMSLVHTSMVFKQSNDKLFKIEFTDIEGQALEPERSVDVARNIIEHIGDCDAVIMLVKAPKTYQDQEVCIDQLTQMYQFAEVLLEKKENIPVCLIINQIDDLPKAKNIVQKIDSEVGGNEPKDLDKVTSGTYASGKNQKLIQKGKVTSKYLKQALYSDEVLEVVSYFSQWIRSMKKRTPARIFFCTSLGFDNVKKNPFNEETMIAQAGAIKPYGTVASILWIIYAHLRLNEGILKELNLEERLPEKLVKELEALHNYGDAFFDDLDDLWATRKLNHPYPIHDANRSL